MVAISCHDISLKSRALETLHFHYLNVLTMWMERNRYVPSTVEWALIQDAYDEKFKRHADMAFLFGFATMLQVRSPSRRSLWRPLYGGLVAYDIALRGVNPCPSMNFWNAAVMLQTPLGDSARVIFSPKVFHQCSGSGADNVHWGAGQWLLWASRSLLLEQTCRSFFDGTVVQSSASIRRQQPLVQQLQQVAARDKGKKEGQGSMLPPVPAPDSQGSAVRVMLPIFSLVLNFRSVRWNPLTVSYAQVSENHHEYAMMFTPKPVLHPEQRDLWLATLVSSQESLNTHTSLLGSLWWNVHSSVMALWLRDRNEA